MKRARAASIIGSEMSMPTQCPFVPSRRATASVVLPVPQPLSSTRWAQRLETLSTIARSQQRLDCRRLHR
jgi:hypothetical protein